MKKRLQKITDTILSFAAFILIAGVVLVILLQVFYRFVLKLPLSWSEELSRFLFVWMVYIGTYIALRRGIVLSITMFIDKLPKQIKKWEKIFSNLLMCFYLIIVLVQGINISIINLKQPSPVLRMPMGYVYFAIPAGAFLMLLNYVLNIFTCDDKEN